MKEQAHLGEQGIAFDPPATHPSTFHHFFFRLAVLPPRWRPVSRRVSDFLCVEEHPIHVGLCSTSRDGQEGMSTQSDRCVHADAMLTGLTEPLRVSRRAY